MQSDAGNAFHVDGPLHDLLQLADFHHGVFSVIITHKLTQHGIRSPCHCYVCGPTTPLVSWLGQIMHTQPPTPI